MGSYGRYLTARESPWKQNGLPSIVNIMQIFIHTSQIHFYCVSHSILTSRNIQGSHSENTHFYYDFMTFFTQYLGLFIFFSVFYDI